MTVQSWRSCLLAVMVFGSVHEEALAAPPSPSKQGQNCMAVSKSHADLASCQRAELPLKVYAFSSLPALPCKGDDIVVDVSLETQAGIPIARKWSKGCQAERRLQWIDGRKCPALEKQLDKLTGINDVEIPGPRFDYRKLGGVLDGKLYELSAPSVYRKERAAGSITLSGNVDSPIGHWFDQTMNALSGCWIDGLPEPGWLPLGG